MASVRSQWWCCACAAVVPGGGVTQLYQAVRVSATTNRCCKVAPGWLTSHVPVTVGCSTCLRVVARQGCYARICATHQNSRGAGEKRYSGRRARTVHCCKLGSSVHEHIDHNGPAVAAESESFRCLRVRGSTRQKTTTRPRPRPSPAADGAARADSSAAPRARKTQQDALARGPHRARDDRKRGGGRDGGARPHTRRRPGRRRGRLRLRRLRRRGRVALRARSRARHSAGRRGARAARGRGAVTRAAAIAHVVGSGREWRGGGITEAVARTLLLRG